MIYLNNLSISAALVTKPSPGCQCGSLSGTSISLHSTTSSSSSKVSLKVNAKLCSTAQATTIAVEQINLLPNPLDKHGNLCFQIPNVLSTT